MNGIEKNSYGVGVKRCCASCAHKGATRLMTLRRCKKHARNVKPVEVCPDWKMSDLLRKISF